MSNADGSFIIVSNLDPNISERNLRAYFSICGPIDGLRLGSLRTNMATMAALIKFENQQSLATALRLNASQIAGHQLFVSIPMPEEVGQYVAAQATPRQND